MLKVELEKINKVLSLYKLGFCDSVKRSSLGLVNTTYFVRKNDNYYVLREVSSQTSDEHLLFETNILEHLEDKNFPLTAKIFSNLGGEKITFFDNKRYTLQNFLPGKIKGNWNNLSGISDIMLENIFGSIAILQKELQNFPENKLKENKTLFWYINNAEREFYRLFGIIPESIGKKMLSKNSLNIIKKAKLLKEKMLDVGYDKLPKQVIHFDINPGNIHFSRNKICGIFDFDWARYDFRFSDVVSTISQSCWHSDDGKHGGIYNKDKINLGISAYRKAYGKSLYSVYEENEYLGVAFGAYCFFKVLFVMLWYSENSNIGNEESLKVALQAFLENDHFSLFL